MRDSSLRDRVDEAQAVFERYAVALAWAYASGVESGKITPGPYEQEMLAKFRAADEAWGQLLMRWCDQLHA